jgi:hypothetical protein
VKARRERSRRERSTGIEEKLGEKEVRVLREGDTEAGTLRER